MDSRGLGWLVGFGVLWHQDWRAVWMEVGTPEPSFVGVSPIIVFVKIVICRFSPYSEGGG